MDYLTMQIRAIYDIKVHNCPVRPAKYAVKHSPPVPIQRILAAFRRFALLADDVAGVAFVFFFGQLDLVQIGI